MLDFVINTARRAGKLLLSRLGQERTLTLKGAIDLATDADQAAEALIVDAIRAAYPEHHVLAEEGGGYGQAAGAPYTWLIDPLDGTTNYAHGFPFFSVSIGLLRAEALVLGVIYDPVRDELFAAQAGQGARLNGRPLAVSRRARLLESLVSTGFPYDRASVADNNLAEFNRLLPQVREIRRSGSAALDLAYVAAGRLEAHWEKRLKPWDTAAGALLVQEAGGQVSTLVGQAWQPGSPDLLASNDALHEALIVALRGDGT